MRMRHFSKDICKLSLGSTFCGPASLALSSDSRTHRGNSQYIFPTGMCHISGYRGIAFAHFVLNGVSKEGNFSGASLENMSNGELLLDRVVI